ncbi:uncharacterized protein LOC122503458 [Leptopilina heterotoma]|uniref:uncharacterized protein LOC122503458 n=1 Tax=Leptopilina heterotoma TaxID=63436 RepID=UPI001CA83834|nr:uncharacterized protein LOC122503458 [Leptopilina heterotoma]
MDEHKAARAVIRASFTRNMTTLERHLKAENIQPGEMKSCLDLLEEKIRELESYNKFIFEHMIKAKMAESEIAAEVDSVDGYKAKFFRARAEVMRVLFPPVPTQTQTDEMSGRVSVLSCCGSGEGKRSFILPKIELTKFSGDVREWLRFWAQFKKIHEDDSMDKGDKFQYLIQAMVKDSRASELVSSYPSTSENYEKVITALQSRFGREEMLVEVYVRALLELVLNNATRTDTKLQLSKIYDKLESQLRALESLGVTTDKCATILYPLVESSLPEELLRAWQRYSSSEKKNVAKDRLTNLMKFLRSEVENEERILLAVRGFSSTSAESVARDEKFVKRKSKPSSEEIPTAAGLVSIKEKTNCIFCDQEHESAECSFAKNMSLEERQKIVKSKNGCFNCLKTGHHFRRCKYNQKCGWCRKKHVIIMCRGLNTSKGGDEQIGVASVSVQKRNPLSMLRNPEIFLQTLKVKLNNGEKQCIVRVALDSCSHRSYILTSIAEKMGFNAVGQQRMIHLLFGGARTEPQNHKAYDIHVSNLSETFKCNFVALSRDTIVENIPCVDNGPWIEELEKKGIVLSDQGTPGEPIAILIGADFLGKLQTGKSFEMMSGPTAIETKLGWTLIGEKLVEKDIAKVNTALCVASLFVREASVSDLWNLDVIGIADPTETKTKREHQEDVRREFQESTTVEGEGRFQVSLPWKVNHPPLPDNFDVAQRRLVPMTKKLIDQNLFVEYDRVFKDWESEGIIEKVPDGELSVKGHYLPHRPVIKENSTTRVRPVYDASAKKKNSPSLNECLETGPNLIELVPTMLIRFREKSVGAVADIKKAFLQICVRPEDRDHLRFLWWTDSDASKLLVYRHVRVVFGVSSSPFLLGAAIDMLLCDALKEELPETKKTMIKKLQRAFYVDNCMVSFDSKEEAVRFKEIAVEVMQQRGFELRGWEYSGENSDQETGVLGLNWNKSEDVLKLASGSFSQEIPAKITKRVILAASHKVFDPIGFVCPVLLKPKLLLQLVCLKNLDWDTEVDREISSTFGEWHKQLHLLSEVKIPRNMCGGDMRSVTFHVFVDASKVAYGAAIFARTQFKDKVKVMIVQAKSRVAPTKGITTKNRSLPSLTIPRLELLAACMGARLMDSVTKALELKQVNVQFWSDSTTVLAWIQRNCPWEVFVSNRVQEIRQLSDPEKWKHVPGKINPADLPSRGCTAQELLESKWWEGPQWLYSPPNQWPSDECVASEDIVNSALKKSARILNETENCASLLTVECPGSNKEQFSERLTRYSSYIKIIRIIAWTRRFTSNASKQRDKRKYGELSKQEFCEAEVKVLRVVQKETFESESDAKIKCLNPCVDESGLIRLQTLISNRKDTENFRYPVVLDPSHDIVRKLIEFHHVQLQHVGVQGTLTNLRERFWVLTGRRAIRSVINKCVICKRHKAKHLEVAPAPLPEARVRDAKVFEIVGIDYAGPVYLVGGQKAWIGLFTCAVYRAVHLELVTRATTAGFLEALRRFISRRGRPSIVYSDNGTNFEGTNNLLKKVNWQEIEKFSVIREIEWRFNPPSAAWWGGWWERLIRILKDLLKRVLRKASLTYEEMNTTLCDCEAVINGRPITYLSDDASEISCLTPAMFLQEVTETGVMDLDQIDRIDLGRRFEYRQRVKDDLRQRFRAEYLGQLSGRIRQVSNDREVKVGEIVLVGHENQKRLNWPLARVLEVLPGRDGKVRVVKLKTATGELIRPVQRLFPLEVAGPIPAINSVKVMSEKCVNKSPIACDELRNEKPKKNNVENENSNVEKHTRSGRMIKVPDRFKF